MIAILRIGALLFVGWILCPNPGHALSPPAWMRAPSAETSKHALAHPQQTLMSWRDAALKTKAFHIDKMTKSALTYVSQETGAARKDLENKLGITQTVTTVNSMNRKLSQAL